MIRSALSLSLAAVFAGSLALTAVPANAATASTWCNAGKPLKFAGLNWESASFLTELLRLVTEKGYGCQTESIPGSTVTMENALASNDVQVLAEEWVGRSDAWNDAAKAGKVKALGKTIVGASEGWYVPDYLVKGDAKRGIKPAAAGLTSVADLPKYKAVFKDAEEPGKGRFLNCPTGWSCEGVNSQKLKAYKLTDSYTNFRPGTGAALDAEIASAYQRGKPVLFYYWAPTALFGKYRFVQLKEPAYNEACFKTLSDKDNAAPCGSASPAALIQVGVSKALNDSDPALVAFFSKFNVPIELLNKTLADQAEHKTPWPQLARDFVRQHPEVVKGWVPADVSTKVIAAAK
ncbi:ABC transporter substrate-binding protein [Neisseriaceae bacterium JH1-16]|nr:ABC transporter substrate-binding protein [Neisseriaceae bacterium JH1-16]